MKNNYKLLSARSSLQGMFLALSFVTLALSLQSQVTYTFTNCGATGVSGPSQAQANTSYTSTNLSGSVVVTGGIQSFTIPVNGLYRIESNGAQGGGSTGGAQTGSVGGLGARMIGDFSFTAGQVIKILVGQEGGSAPYGGGGGGGTYVVDNANAPLCIAGGGGGGNGYVGYSRGVFAGGPGLITTGGGNSNQTIGAYGAAAPGAGGGAIAMGGTSGYGGGGALGGGGGGLLNSGGVGSNASPGLGFLQGGTGGAGNGGTNNGGFGGGGGGVTASGYGGGGGGYSGGGSGNWDGTTHGNGGGGGSFNSGTNQNNTAGVNPSHGKVIITRLCNIALGTNTGNNMLCQGSALTLTTDAISSYTWSTGSNASFITVSPGTTTSYTLTAMSPSNCITSAAITISVNTAAPVLTVTASSPTVCLGNTVSISATGALSYTFSGGISNAVPFAPSATTAYTIQGQNGCGTVSNITTITITPLPVVGIASSSVVCVGNTTSLSATGATNYTWQPGSNNGANIAVNPQSSTIYTVTGTSGNCSGVNTVAVNTNPNPTITSSSTHTSLCQGQSATLTAGGGLSYTWQPGGQTGSPIVVSPTSPTGYMVTGNNSFGCTSTAQQAMPVFASPTVNLSTNTPTICSGGTAILLATGANTYTWSTNATTNTISVTPATTTIYTVVGTNASTQCTDTKMITVNVFVPNVLISPNTAICIGGTATLTASGAQNYQWSTGGSGPIISVNPTSTSMYTVTGTTPIGSQNCAGTNTTQVTVNPLPTVTAVATRSNICKNENTQLTAGGANTYSWNTGATTTVITVNPLTNTSYSVQGTSTFGCKNSVFVLVRVFTCPGFVENNLEDSRLQVYPNPSKGMVNIQTYEAMELLLVNQLGQVVQTITTQEQHQYSVQLKDLSAGVYFLQAKDPQLKLNKKLIVQE